MLLIVANVLYILIAIAMVVLILLQRGAGANAGSGFGGGASATVFGARGSANFLSRSTAVLAALFFLLSLGMGMYLGRPGARTNPVGDLGLMSGSATPAKAEPAAPSTKGDVPQPMQPAASPDTPAATPPATSDKPASGVDVQPAPGKAADVPRADLPSADTANAAKPAHGGKDKE